MSNSRLSFYLFRQSRLVVLILYKVKLRPELFFVWINTNLFKKIT